MRLTIRKKMLAGFLGISLFTLGLGVFALVEMNSMQADTHEITAKLMPAIEALAEVREQFNLTRLGIYRVINNRRADASREETHLNQEMKALAEAEQAYAVLLATDEERRIWENYKATAQDYLKAQNQIIELLDQGQQ
ncbi:MAG TPA: MCP four helix bundle domain-containing protein, partial [Blastocatellia bacterium]|nr:MCP four helix bundle domain-containing protein [Blastocatellia bacterium]